MLRGPLSVVLARLAGLALIHSLLRLAFWALNQDSFPSAPFSAFLGGMRFDLVAIAWLNIPWITLFLMWPSPSRWAAVTQRPLFHLGNAIGFFLNAVDIEYYRFTLKRSTSDLLTIGTAGTDLRHLAGGFLVEFWHVAAIFIACLVLAELLWRWSGRATGAAAGWRRWSWRAMVVALMAVLWRGGLQLVPIGPATATRYADAAYSPLVLNSAFTFFHGLGKPALSERHYMSQEEADRLWPVIHQFADSAIAGARPNVVVIILESFSAAYSERLSGHAGRCMPFLDSLMGTGLNFEHAYANGRRSIDGLPAILASLPELMNEAFVASRYAQLPFTSLPGVLKEEGYRTSFYHGGHNGTMGFDGFARQAGIERYVGYDEYPDRSDDDGTWGVLDRPFLQFFAQELQKEQQPFFSTLFTLTSHHPYKLPDPVAARFAGGDHRIEPTLRYADDALRRFFATVRGSKWFRNTLFVITADHTADLKRDGQLVRDERDYWVPLLFYMPERIEPGADDRVVQHIDILPTVLHLIGHHGRFFSFGHSVLQADRPPIAISSSNSIYMAIGSGRRQLKFDGEHVLPPPATAADAPTRDMEPWLKAAIQQFNGHLLRGDLTAKP